VNRELAIVAGVVGIGAALFAAPRTVEAKEGVQLAGLEIDVLEPAIRAADRAARTVGQGRAVITSALDGVHKRMSLHYAGRALDFRRVDWPHFDDVQRAARQAELIAAELGERYDVILEDTHIHVEYDPPAETA